MNDEMTKPALAILQPDWDKIKPANVDALMTLREGGVSSGPFGGKDGVGGFNVGLYSGDMEMCVTMNRRLASQLVPTDPKWLKQVHGDRVVDAETAKPEEEADASTSVTPGVVCVVQVADCLPVLLAEKSGKAVAAVHCGWRSLASGILQKRLRVCVKDWATLTLNLSLGLAPESATMILKRAWTSWKRCVRRSAAQKWLLRLKRTANTFVP